MERQKDAGEADVAWFVGASFGKKEDQTQRFITEGIWEVRNPTPHESAQVRSMKPGDRIAIKASYVRKRELPFDNRGHPVSVFSIKAVGTILSNPQDGERVVVDWRSDWSTREWYFYTYRATIWRVVPDDWKTQNLIAFAFEGAPQEIDRFCNAPYWHERFGIAAPEDRRFVWTRFYEAIADALLEYRRNRLALLKGIRAIAQRVEGLGYLDEDKFADGTTGALRDICPFTVMGMFNRGVTDTNRKAIANELAKLLGVDEPVPKTFEGIPLLNNLKSWYFPFEAERSSEHIDSLWEVFAAALEYADSDDEEGRSRFAIAFDNSNGRPTVGWNLTFGLYWARPWSFISLDANSKLYVSEKLGITIGRHGPKNRCNAADYLTVMDVLERNFQESSYPVHSFPELSLDAWRYKDPAQTVIAEVADVDSEGGLETAPAARPVESYTVDNIIEDGCFLDRGEIVALVQRLRDKKNLVLQGPPGTGKTWLAKRLAFALIGQKDESKVRAVQFHPTLSYEDFVRGWRPTGDGKLSLANGTFMEVVEAAKLQPAEKFVVVIEEINRGNPAQIFGELLTLLEAGKRTPSEALELCYPDKDGKRRPVYVPENLYVVGTMNVADRSLALVDLALRRRFAFVALEPRLGQAWCNWVVEKCGVERPLAVEIAQRFRRLNEQIEGDQKLGQQFRIGHSYVTPTTALEQGAARKWFEQVVETEIRPLLDEYWFDTPGIAQKACEQLLQGW
jgi:5-methylcytosine-specific restriction protein B